MIVIRRICSKYRLGILGAATIVLLWGVSGAVAWNYFEGQRVSGTSSAKQSIDEMNKKIDQLREKAEERKRLEEENAKEQAEAEAKKRAEEEAQQAAGQNQSPPSGGSSCNMATAHANPNAIDVLVNKKHCLQPLSFIPPDLVSAHGATISAKAAGDFNRMFVDAAAAGLPFDVSSSYRSYATQVSTYNYWVSVNGQVGADTVSARPGYSEHQTGLAVDVAVGDCTLDCFSGTSQYQWFQVNAASYGFIQRYYAGFEAITGYASEEWHYRYVGVATAQDMKARGVKTLEQYWGMEGGNYR